MRLKYLLPMALFALGAAGCNTDEILTVPPATVVDADVAITDEVSARAAAAGMYDALQSTSYYGGNFFLFEDLLADNARHSGTFTSYREADLLNIQIDNSAVEAIWIAIYRSISRANALIEKLPAVQGMDPVEKDQLLGEAYFIRALGLHNATKLWGEVPIITQLITSPVIAAQATRATVPAVYTQIHADLDQAELLMQGDNGTRHGSLGAARALRARVYLYQGNYPAAEAAADVVIGMGYTLAPNYATLFAASGTDTPEDIFRVAFNDQDAANISFYYLTKPAGGRFELAPTAEVQTRYEVGDLRKTITFGQTGTTNYVRKYASIAGTEHLHVIRFAEVLLIKAEAQARQGLLNEALATLTPIRARAGLLPLSLGAMTQAEVITAVIQERRVELAFEGDRLSDLTRTGLAVTVLSIPAFKMLLPIPRNQRDVTPLLSQNPGY
jgi:hypothetical protein